MHFDANFWFQDVPKFFQFDCRAFAEGGRGVSGFIGRGAHNPDRHHHHRKGSSRPGNIAATTIRYYL